MRQRHRSRNLHPGCAEGHEIAIDTEHVCHIRTEHVSFS